MVKINPIYLDNIENVKRIFDSCNWLPSVKIKNFLNDYETLEKEIKKLKFKKVKTPIYYSYSKAEFSDNFFNSKEFIDFVSFVIGKKIKKIDL